MKTFNHSVMGIVICTLLLIGSMLIGDGRTLMFNLEGLVGMLAGIGDTGVILRTIPVALTSTLYGILVAYFICIPIAENIHARTQEELLIHKLIAEGVTLIGQEYNTMRLQTRLQSFITPHERDIQNMSIKEIRDKYEELKNSRLEK